jgi:hypothetical protein
MGAKTPKETEEARALAEIAAQRFNRYKQAFAPLEDQYIQQVFDVRSQGNYETAGGLAAAEFQKSFQTANDQAASEMYQQGVDPSSGAFEGNSAALRRAQGVRQGLGVSGAKLDNTTRFYDGMRGVIAMGQGQSADAIRGLGDIAKSSQERANQQAETSFQNNSALRGGMTQGLGLLASPYVNNKLTQPKTSSPTFSGQG